MMTLTSLALLCSSRTVTVTVWVCPPSVLEIQTAPPCWMRRTVGRQRAPLSLHRGTALWDPAGAPDAAPSAADWTVPLQAPASGDPHLCSPVRATLTWVTVLATDCYLKLTMKKLKTFIKNKQFTVDPVDIFWSLFWLLQDVSSRLPASLCQTSRTSALHATPATPASSTTTPWR